MTRPGPESQGQGRPGTRLARRAFGAALAVFAGTAVAAAEPALWVARDADSTVYLFGTFHVLKDDAAWESETTMNAFLASDDLWLEVDLAAGGGVDMMKYGARPGHPLSASLTPLDLGRLKAAAAALGVPFATLEPLRPWLASVIIARASLVKAGYTASGADTVLARLAERTGKPVHGFETTAEQFAYFAGLSPTAEVAVLQGALDEAEESSDYFDTVAGAWLAGDTRILENRALAEVRDLGEEVYGTLVTRRNEAMAETIRAVMDGSGTHFVAVGAAHLIGPDSIQRHLAGFGIASERLVGRDPPTEPLSP